MLTHLLAIVSLYIAPALAAEAPLGLLAVPTAIAMDKFAHQNHLIPRLIKPLKLKAINWHTAVTVALFLAYFTAGVKLHGTEKVLL